MLRLLISLRILIFEVEHIDQEVILDIIDLEYSLREKGVEILDRDLIIAAIAKRKKATVVTRDKKHFTQLSKFNVSVEIIE